MAKYEKIKEKETWKSPEAHAFIEGNVKENSDIFSLAAIMAWDFGIIKNDDCSILNSLWSLYQSNETNTFVLGGEKYSWTIKTQISDFMKRFRTVLLKALDPLPEKRTVSARDMAFEIMLMANRLSENPETVIDESNFKKVEHELSHTEQKLILTKEFNLPEKITSFILAENKSDGNRLWIEARSKTASKYSLIRGINNGLNIIGKNSLYFGSKFSEYNVPFYCLDLFCARLISFSIYLNPQMLQAVRNLIYDCGNEIEQIFFVLPSLEKYYENKNISKNNTSDSHIFVKHDELHSNIQTIIEKIITLSKIEVMIIDDINRSDESSISVFLKIFQSKKITSRWVIGVRSDELKQQSKFDHEIILHKSKELSYVSTKEDRTISFWITKINQLTEVEARFLAGIATSSYNIEMDGIENLSSKIVSVEGVISQSYHGGKSSESSIHKFNDLVPNENIKINNEKNTEKQSKDFDVIEEA